MSRGKVRNSSRSDDEVGPDVCEHRTLACRSFVVVVDEIKTISNDIACSNNMPWQIAGLP